MLGSEGPRNFGGTVKGRPVGLSPGDIVEVWDMPKGEWTRAHVVLHGRARYYAGKILCQGFNEGTGWRHIAALGPHSESAVHDEKSEPPGTTPWRVGRKAGRTLYDKNDRLIGMVDSPDMASLVVEAVNGFWGKDVEPEVFPRGPAAPPGSATPESCGLCGVPMEPCGHCPVCGPFEELNGGNPRPLTCHRDASNGEDSAPPGSAG